ncbi:MAG: hypothetical protein WC139_12180 [Candidatus Kapaibacterium sp.]
MKIIYVLFLILAFHISFSHAQNNVQSSFNKKFNVEIRVGPSFPYGDLGKTDALNKNSGFAKIGFKAEAVVGYKLVDVLGINVMGFYNSNGTDLTNLTQQLNNQTGRAWTTDSKSWNIYGGLLGLEYSYPASKSIVVGFKAYSGIMSTTSPKVELTSGADSFVQEEKSTTALTYMFSLSGAYPLSNNIFWISSIGFLGATPKFENVKTVTTINGVTTESTDTFNQDMKVFIVDTGIKIVF